MELYDYNKLNLDQRAETLWKNGVFVINLREELYSYNLYTFFGYFVEVKLSNSENKIIDIRSFRKGEILNKYVDVIDINQMI